MRAYAEGSVGTNSVENGQLVFHAWIGDEGGGSESLKARAGSEEWERLTVVVVMEQQTLID